MRSPLHLSSPTLHTNGKSVVSRHYAKAFSIQEIPSRRSISAMVLNEKLVFPDNILLTYCGVHPNRSAISALDKLFSCMKSTIFRAMLCDHFIQALFSCLHLASSTNEEASWLSCASKNLNVFSIILSLRTLAWQSRYLL